jgi:hypothetical protein
MNGPAEIGLPIVLDDPHDGAPLSDEQRAKLAAWFDRSIGDRCREGPSIWVSGTIRCEELP